MSVKNILLFSVACLAIAACNNQQESKTATGAPSAVASKPQLAEPFKFHKFIEVAPGDYYDVLSWGRGAKGGGAYTILRSDSSDQQYDAINGDLEGPIQDVLNSDLDIDGNPEIIIAAKSIDTNRYTNVYAYEYHDKQAQKLDFPRMTVSQRKGFRGNDRFYIKDGKLMREFTVYEGSGSAAKPTAEKRLLEYSLHGSSLSAKQVSTDSTITSKVSDKKVTPPDGVQNKETKVVAPVEQKQEQSKSSRHSERSERHSRHKKSERRSSERHHKSETKKKRRHHR
jgi:hypothetical protein